MAIKDISDFEALLAVAAYCVTRRSWGEGLRIIYEPFPELEPKGEHERGWPSSAEALMRLTGRSSKECRGALERAIEGRLVKWEDRETFTARGWDALVEGLTPHLERLDLGDVTAGAAPERAKMAGRL